MKDYACEDSFLNSCQNLPPNQVYKRAVFLQLSLNISLSKKSQYEVTIAMIVILNTGSIAIDTVIHLICKGVVVLCHTFHSL